MMKRIQNLLYPQLASKAFKNDDELYLFLVLGAIAILAGLTHLVLLVLTLTTGVMLLAIVNMFSILIYGVSFALNMKRQYMVSGLLITVEVIVYTVLSIYMIGTDSYIFLLFFIALIIQIIIPYTKAQFRTFVGVILWGATVAAIYFGYNDTSLVDLGSYRLLYSMVNVNLAYLAMVVELSIGFFIKKVIVHYNDKKLEDMTNQAYTDSLTGLYNRRYAEQFFERMKNDRRDGRWCVAILDVDDFKLVNDLNGHLVGDAVLRHIADIMRSSLRKSDVIFRWGGEEFLLFLDNVDLFTAYAILEKLRMNLAQTPTRSRNVLVRFTATIGVVELDHADLQGSIARCDQKLYQGKSQGKNRVVM